MSQPRPPSAPPLAIPLFKGATRLPTLFGVPVMPLLGMVMAVAAMAMLAGLAWWFLLPPLWLLMAQVTRHDDKAFRELWLWIDHTGRNRNKGWWQASTWSRQDDRPARRRI